MSDSGGVRDMFPNQDPPAGWPKPHRSVTRVLSAVGFTLLTLITAAVAVSAVVTGDLAQALTFAVGTVLFAHLVGLVVSLMRQAAPATHEPSVGFNDQGERGLAFPYSRWAYYWLSSVLVAVLLVDAGLAVQFGAAGAWVMVVPLAAIALFLAWFLIAMLRLAPGRVVLTPSGIYHRSLVFEHFVPWDAVVDVAAQEGHIPRIIVKALPSIGTRERKHMGRLSAGIEGLPFLVVRTYWLGANALPANLALKHYLLHSDERTRLKEIGGRAAR
ncbi:hypothetical protein [Krasilnikovia sp. MM14-A1004]|uniref:hypothetical protein n=1 Tax=Krasilnikovia sp. MM14-A1004 TaxID=3373541 RepID=UPI00399D2C79